MPFSPKNPFSIAGTFSGVLFFTMLKEAYEDFYRHKQDRQINSILCHKLDVKTKSVIEVFAKDIQVGDILLVHNDEYFPADMILLASSYIKGVAYVNTMNLDGESNLKEKFSVSSTRTFNTTALISDLKIFAECDNPSSLFE